MSERITIAAGAANLACDVSGDGPPLVLLHAGVADRRVWGAATPHLAARHHVYAYDRRGFGDTAYVPEVFSHTADLAAVLDRAGPEGAVLIGNSQGGRIALDYALDHPEQVRALVLVAPAISGMSLPTEVAAEDLALDEAAEAAWEAGDLAEANRLEAHLWLDGPREEEGRVGGPARALFLDMNGRALAAADPGEAVTPASAWDRLESLIVPTLVMIGDRDVGYLHAIAEELTERAVEARLVSLEGVAHLPMLEDPAGFVEAVTPFLDTT